MTIFLTAIVVAVLACVASHCGTKAEAGPFQGMINAGVLGAGTMAILIALGVV